ncbi:MAG: hypothetical protein WB778_03900 [Thermoplasmata archaeon]|jgi:hypothetical protein
MAADSPYSGATLRSVEELTNHAEKQYRLDGAGAPGAPGVPGGPESFSCALCGKQYTNKGQLIRHALGPHYRTNRSTSWVSAQPI